MNTTWWTVFLLRLEFARGEARLTCRSASRLRAWYYALDQTIVRELEAGRRRLELQPFRSRPGDLRNPRLRGLEDHLRGLFGDRVLVVRELERPAPTDAVELLLGP